MSLTEGRFSTISDIAREHYVPDHVCFIEEPARTTLIDWTILAWDIDSAIRYRQVTPKTLWRAFSIVIGEELREYKEQIVRSVLPLAHMFMAICNIGRHPFDHVDAMQLRRWTPDEDVDRVLREETGPPKGSTVRRIQTDFLIMQHSAGNNIHAGDNSDELLGKKQVNRIISKLH